jgi:hypothetical protein
MEKTSKTKLYFIQDLSFGSRKQVYSGSSGTGRNFKMFQSDYGKYAMQPQPKSRCKEMIKEIEKNAKGRSGLGTSTFKWDLVPMTEIDLCNFYTDDAQKTFDNLKKQQLKLK